MSINKVILIGRLGADPEMRDLSNGEKVANFSVATSEKYKDKSGEMKEKTEWTKVVAFGKLGALVGNYLKKGSNVYVEGKLQTRQWEDKAKVKHYTTEVLASSIQFLDKKSEASNEATGDKPGLFD